SKRYNASLNRRQRTNQAAALRLKHENHRKPKMPRVVCRFEAFVRAIQTTNSLGNEALSLHSMKTILTNKTFCNQTTKPKTPIQSRI
ncbi:hypothetical protein, partial [Vibrio sp. S9_S30]|uniref:hypothetical protein n=1 Tax=Vibrio sp. S9_S30 TaxID=2720226 RepID=UPI001EEDC0DB